MKKRNKVLDYLSYLALRCLAALFHLFPIDMNLRTGRWMGDILWKIINSDIPLVKKILRRKHRDQIMDNLRIAFGKEYSEKELEAIAKASCRHLVMFAIECLYSERLISLYSWYNYITFKNFEPALKVLLENRGAILLTGHYGSWEVLGYVLATLGFDIVAVMRPPDNPYINEYIVRIREQHGLRLLYKKGASASMEQIVRQGSPLGFIADQDAGHKGLFVDFFGQKASTYKSIALVAREMNVPLIIGCARRTSWEKFRYEVEAEEIIHPHEWQGQENEVLYITTRFNQALERMVRKDPTQYLWLHRRWKSKPPEQRSR
ncbi:MAG: lysophospholipid acyltransferase family protein [Phycisphaerae bacterium]